MRKLAMKSQLIASSSTTPPSASPIAIPQGQGEKSQHLSVRSHDGHANTSAPSTLSHALKSLNDFDATMLAMKDRPQPVAYDSPYSRSIPSTAPGSPRMYVSLMTQGRECRSIVPWALSSTPYPLCLCAMPPSTSHLPCVAVHRCARILAVIRPECGLMRRL